jgi:ubiquinone/menaquinone biosynthesis C-methylase UbiE
MFLTPDHLVQELYLQPGDKVADIGCGTGAYTVALSRVVGEIGQVYAVDVHRDMLHTLQTTLERMSMLNVDILWADVEQVIPLDKFSLDAVVLSNVLFQFENHGKALNLIHDILKPEGQLLVVDWSHSHKGIGPHESHVVNEARAEELMQKHGFRVIKRLPAGDYHYAFIALSV